MSIKTTILLLLCILAIPTNAQQAIPLKNKAVIDSIIKHGPSISPTYEKAVCTEMVIRLLEKFVPLTKTDKSRIRIITTDNIQVLLKQNSPIPKGVYYALTAKGIGKSIDEINKVLPGDFVQFWTESWGHCGIVKEIHPENATMLLYSSFPSTNGYGIQIFSIPQHCYFARLK